MQLGTAYSGHELTRPGERPVSGYRPLEQTRVEDACEVWSAEGPGGLPVALKFLRLASDPDAVEGQVRKRLQDARHPNLVACFGVWRVGAFLVLGTELPDRTLWDRFAEAIDVGKPGIPRDELLDALEEAAKGLDHLGGPHGGLTPQSLVQVGGGIKVADYEQGPLRDAGLVPPARGPYTAPEGHLGPASGRSDQYALAAIYVHLRGGRPTRADDAPTDQPPDLSALPEVERPPLARALAHDPADRWPDCRGFVAALRAAAPPAGRWNMPPTIFPPAVAADATPRPLGRRRRPRLLTAAAVLATAGLTLWVASLGSPGRHPAPATTRRVVLRPPLPAAPEPGPVATVAPGPERPRPEAALPAPLPPIDGTPDVLPLELTFAATPEPPTVVPPVVPTLGLVAPERLELTAGERSRLPIRVRRAGLDGATIVRFEGLPPGITVADLTVPTDRDEVVADVVAARDAPEAEAEVTAVGRAGVLQAATTLRLAVRPAPALVHRRQGRRHLSLGEYDRAIAAFAEALRADPGDAETWIDQGLAYSRTNDHDRAIAAFTEAIRLRSDDAAALNNRGLAYRARGDYHRAVADYTEVVALRPRDPIVRFNRGMAYLHAGDPASALLDFDEAIRLKPDYARVYRVRGDVHARLGHAAQARADHAEADRLDPSPSRPVSRTTPRPRPEPKRSTRG